MVWETLRPPSLDRENLHHIWGQSVWWASSLVEPLLRGNNNGISVSCDFKVVIVQAKMDDKGVNEASLIHAQVHTRSKGENNFPLIFTKGSLKRKQEVMTVKLQEMKKYFNYFF